MGLSGWRYRALIWSVLVAAAGYLAFAFWSGWHDVAIAVGKVGFLGICVALILSLINYGLRFLRWQSYLTAMGNPVPWRPSLRIYLSGFALTTSPGKAGEALRGVFLKSWGLPYSRSFAAFLSERLSDLSAILLLALFGLSLYPRAGFVVLVGTIALAAVLLVVSSADILRRLANRISDTTRWGIALRHLLDVLKQAGQCHSRKILAYATTLSLIAWAAEAWAFHLVLQWMGLEVPLSLAIFVYAISLLAGALSFLPGGLGGVEASMTALLIMSGIGEAEAVAATIIIRLATLWFAVAIGVVALALSERGNVN